MTGLTQAHLKTILNYDPETGALTWLKNRRKVKPGDIAGGKYPNGYLNVRIDFKRYLFHRVVWLYVHGTWPLNDIDHINGIRSDNRIVNLREATRSQNKANSPKRVDSQSPFKGILKSGNRWGARIFVNGKSKWLGVFDTPELAQLAYVQAAKSNFGEFARPE